MHIKVPNSTLKHLINIRVASSHKCNLLIRYIARLIPFLYNIMELYKAGVLHFIMPPQFLG